MNKLKRHALTLLAFVAIAVIWSLIIYEVLLQITSEP